MTTVCAWEKTVVMVKQPGHLTSMKKDRGAGTKFWLKLVPCVFSISPMTPAVVSYLELVSAGLSGSAWVEEINGENLEGKQR